MNWNAPVTRPDETDYAWIIDVDHLAEPGASEGSWADNAATVVGPGNANPEMLRFLRDAGTAAAQGTVVIDGRTERVKAYRFKMFDDDGELYYTGRMVTFPNGPSEEACYAPLGDFGTPNAGATEIRYPGHPDMDCG